MIGTGPLAAAIGATIFALSATFATTAPPHTKS